MTEQLQLRRGPASQVASFTGAQGECVVDTTNNRLVVNDGATAGGWPAAKLAEVITNTRVDVADAAYAALASDRLIAYTALTTARAVTLPAASAYPTGTRLTVIDESGACSATLTLTANRAGSDTIDGATSCVVNTPYGHVSFEGNGSNAWTIVDRTANAAAYTLAQGANGSFLQAAVLEQSVTLSGASTTAAVQIPAGALVIGVSSRVTTTVVGPTSFEIGVSGTLNQFGSGLSLPAGSTNEGLIGPNPFYSATSIIVTATGGNFSAGVLRLSIAYLTLGAPTS